MGAGDPPRAALGRDTWTPAACHSSDKEESEDPGVSLQLSSVRGLFLFFILFLCIAAYKIFGRLTH